MNTMSTVLASSDMIALPGCAKLEEKSLSAQTNPHAVPPVPEEAEYLTSRCLGIARNLSQSGCGSERVLWKLG
ncbi:Protein of unknown function [Pyronema omphalodes CBS 100304]|uniref:Uncharacterized protein n=1 Tax=Pyronema omphalodes (strain CBS 100304) TaxID=1076935 RepID=U4L666_PYROM|nr:Protein of unknown function [Pyronema omphalodes CBS 100304]